MSKTRLIRIVTLAVGSVALAGFASNASIALGQAAGGGSSGGASSGGSSGASGSGTGSTGGTGGLFEGGSSSQTGGGAGGISSGGYGGTVSGDSAGTSAGTASGTSGAAADTPTVNDAGTSGAAAGTGRTSPSSPAIRTGEAGRAINTDNAAIRPGATDNVTPRAQATPGTPDSTDAGASAAAAGSSIATEPDRSAVGTAGDRNASASDVVDDVNTTGNRAAQDVGGRGIGVADTAQTAGGVINNADSAAVTAGGQVAADRSAASSGTSAAGVGSRRIDRDRSNVRVPGGNRNRPITTDSRRAGDLVIDPAAAVDSPATR